MSSFINYSTQADQIQEIPKFLCYIIKFFLILPIIERISNHFKRYALLPDDLEHFDFFGNFIGNTKDLLENDEICEKMMNYTETFKNFVDYLYKGEGNVNVPPKDNWIDEEEIFNYPETRNIFLFKFDLLVDDVEEIADVNEIDDDNEIDNVNEVEDVNDVSDVDEVDDYDNKTETETVKKKKKVKIPDNIKYEESSEKWGEGEVE